MKKYLSGHDIFNELKMMRTRFKGSLLVLERPTDCSLFDAFTVPAGCETIPAHGRSNVTTCVQLADVTNSAGILGIIDADFDHFNGIPSVSPNIGLSDYHDTEMMLLLSSVMDRLVLQYGDRAKLDRVLAAAQKTALIDVVLVAGRTVGALRWLSLTRNLRLRFRDATWTFRLLLIP